MERYCPECGERIIGRSDKKFCSDQCRTSHHNRLNSGHIGLMRNINAALRRNRQILIDLNPDGKIKLPLKKLLEKGFDLEHFTSIYQTRSGSLYRYCYEQGYLLLDNDEVLLVRKKEGR